MYIGGHDARIAARISRCDGGGGGARGGGGGGGAQAPAARNPPMAEEVFKNIRVLRGIPVDEFMGTMGVFSAALGMSCEDCHSSSDTTWENYALDTSPRKALARPQAPANA